MGLGFIGIIFRSFLIHQIGDIRFFLAGLEFVATKVESGGNM